MVRPAAIGCRYSIEQDAGDNFFWNGHWQKIVHAARSLCLSGLGYFRVQPVSQLAGQGYSRLSIGSNQGV